MHILPKKFIDEIFYNIKVGQASKYSIENNDILSLIAGQGGVDCEVLDQLFNLYDICDRKARNNNESCLQNTRKSKCQNENKSDIKIEIDKNEVKKINVDDNINISSYDYNVNDKEGKMHQIDNNDASIGRCDIILGSNINHDSNSGLDPGSVSSILLSSNTHEPQVTKHFGLNRLKKLSPTEINSTFNNEKTFSTADTRNDVTRKNQLDNLSDKKAEDENYDFDIIVKLNRKKLPNEIQSSYHSMCNYIKIANSLVFDNFPKIIENNKSYLISELLERSEIKVDNNELSIEFQNEINKKRSRNCSKKVPNGNCNKKKVDMENSKSIHSLRINSEVGEDNSKKIEIFSHKVASIASLNSNSNSCSTSICDIHNDHLSTEILPYLGKRKRKYSEVWNEEDFIYKSKQSNKFNLITDWSSLINNYDDNYDGVYKDWSIQQRSLSINKRKKELRKTNDLNNINFEIISPPVPTSIIHPGSWGKDRQENIEKYLDALKRRQKVYYDKKSEIDLIGTCDSKIVKKENRRNCNHETKKKNICISKKSDQKGNSTYDDSLLISTLDNINNNTRNSHDKYKCYNNNENDIKNIYQFIHPASVSTKKFNEINVHDDTINQGINNDSIDELTLQHEIIYRELQAIEASNYLRLCSLNNNVMISTQLNVVRAKRKQMEEVLTQMYQCNEMKYIAEGCVTYENIPVPIPAPLLSSSSSSSSLSPMLRQRKANLNIKTRNKINEKIFKASPRYQLGACLLHHIPHGDFISRAKIGVRNRVK